MSAERRQASGRGGKRAGVAAPLASRLGQARTVKSPAGVAKKSKALGSAFPKGTAIAGKRRGCRGEGGEEAAGKRNGGSAGESP